MQGYTKLDFDRMKKKILIIDDEKGFTDLLTEYLGGTERYKVEAENNGKEGIAAIQRFKPDLILLDILLPDMGGIEICKSLKEQEKFASIPVIIISGQKREGDKVSGLDIGADDYLVKPFSLKELEARIRAVLRRAGMETAENEIKVGNTIEINLEKHLVTIDKKKIALTPTEFTILRLFASKKGRVFSRSNILEYLSEEPSSVTERTVDVHIKHLREKLGSSAKLIQNVRGIGYKLEIEN